MVVFRCRGRPIAAVSQSFYVRLGSGCAATDMSWIVALTTTNAPPDPPRSHLETTQEIFSGGCAGLETGTTIVAPIEIGSEQSRVTQSPEIARTRAGPIEQRTPFDFAERLVRSLRTWSNVHPWGWSMTPENVFAWCSIKCQFHRRSCIIIEPDSEGRMGIGASLSGALVSTLL